MWFVFVFYLFYVMWVVFVFVFVLCNAVGPAAARRAELVLGDSASPARLCKHRLGLLYSTVLDCAGTSHRAKCFDKYICKHCITLSDWHCTAHFDKLAISKMHKLRRQQDGNRQDDNMTTWQNDNMAGWYDAMIADKIKAIAFNEWAQNLSLILDSNTWSRSLMFLDVLLR